MSRRRLSAGLCCCIALASMAWIGPYALAQEGASVSWLHCPYRIVNTSPPSRFQLTFTFGFGAGVADGAEMRVVLDYRREGFTCLRFTSSGVSAVAAANDTASSVGRSFPLPGSLLSGRHDVLVRRDAARIDVFVDGRLACQVLGCHAPVGGVGFGSCRARPVIERVRFQELGEIHFSDDFMREGSAGDEWDPVLGRWALSYVRDVARSANPFRCVGRAKTTGILLTGHPFWHDYEVAAAAKCGDGGGFGLWFYYRDSANYCLFHWLGPDCRSGNRLSLIHVQDGRERILATREARFRPDQWYKLSVRVSDRRIEAGIDGHVLFDVACDDLCGGRAGLCVHRSENAFFDDVVIRPSAPVPDEARPIRLFSRTFETDKEMDNWASIWSSWETAVGSGPGTTFWHKGCFFNDVSIAVPAPDRTGRPGRLSFVLRGDGRAPDSGYGVAFHVGGDGRIESASITAGGKRLAEQRIAGEPGVGACLGGGIRGNRVVALIDGREVLQAGVIPGVDGKRIACAGDGMKASLKDVRICSQDVHDYLFETAPVDWELELGDWKVSNRWVCDPRWSWMSGRSDLLSVMWHKKRFQGDVVVEFFAGLQMREGRDPYPHRGDINLTLCGDGHNLDSGYSFIYGGWGNRWTRILRRYRIVSGTDSFLIPGNLHRRWFHVKAARLGNKVQLFIDGKLVRQFVDPDPLPGGRIAIWTYDNGLMLSRVRIYASDVSDGGLVLGDGAEKMCRAAEERPHGAPPDQAGELVRTDFESGVQGWHSRSGIQGARVEIDDTTAASGRHSLRLTNVRGGGDFGACLAVPECDLRRFPVISFAYRIPEGVRVNLYLDTDDGMREIALTGPSGDWVGAVRPLGKAKGIVADGTWRRAVIDAGPFLRGSRRGADRFVVKGIMLGNLSNRQYVLCGFGANREGATYHIDDFAILRRRD